MLVRDPAAADEAGWRRLWTQYNAFYRAEVADAVTEATWRRILDPASSMFARVAEREHGIVGFAICVVHEGTWTISQQCYLEDLFVDPKMRGRGIGRALMDDLVRLARGRGWSRLYWHTAGDNAMARRLYDRFVEADGFVRYRVVLD